MKRERARTLSRIITNLVVVAGLLFANRKPVTTVPQDCLVICNSWGYDFNPGNLIYNPDPGFCGVFPCIANFPNGVGYVAECADSNYSKSGGRQGACSYHGGVKHPLYSH